MATNRTFTMVKPDAVEKNYIGGILAKINEAGYRIVAMKYTSLLLRRQANFTKYTANVRSTGSWLTT